MLPLTCCAVGSRTLAAGPVVSLPSLPPLPRLYFSALTLRYVGREVLQG